MKLLKALALGTVPVVGAFLCVLLLQVSGAVVKAEQDLHGVAGQTVSTLQGVDGAVTRVNVAVDQFTPVAAKLVHVASSADRTLQLINKPCVPGPCGTLADVNKTLGTARLTMGQIEIAANHEDKNLGTLDAQEAQIFADSDRTLKDTDALVASPEIQASLHNLDVSTAQAAAILADGRDEADKFVHPPKKKLGFWGAITAAAEMVHKFEPPLF